MRKWLREWLGIDFVEKMQVEHKYRIEHLESSLQALNNKECIETNDVEEYKNEFKVLESRIQILENRIKKIKPQKHVDEYVN